VAGFISDQEVGQGPLHAMICGFEAIDAREILVVSCDQPWLSPEAAGFLAEPLPEGVDARVPRMDGKFQVLTALYRRGVLTQMKEAWSQGVRSPTRFLDGLSVRSVSTHDLEARGVDPACLLDFDTAQDLKRGGSANK
jgi:molybdopterin-guanine dinucleotide biosynthesis protein A